ncbi:Tipa [Entamoeba marina]
MKPEWCNIPYGDIPPPFLDNFHSIDKSLLEQLSSVKIKDGLQNAIISKLDTSVENFLVSGKTEDPIIVKGLTVQSISNYPTLSKDGGPPVRDGDPIADAFCVLRCRNFIIFCVCDGCGWGKEPSYAAHVASVTFVKYIKYKILNNKHYTCNMIIEEFKNGISLAHQTLCDLEVEENKQPGTCTFSGGIVVPIISNELLKIINVTKPTKIEEVYQLINITVGDCKVYTFKKKENTYDVTDITFGSRLKALNPNDPGGRIGFQKKPNRSMDLRNCLICHDILNWNDITKTRGLNPWDVDSKLEEEMNRVYSINFLSEIASHSVSVHQFNKILFDAVIGVVRDRKKYMEDHVNERVPEILSGKLDHATGLIARPTI